MLFVYFSSDIVLSFNELKDFFNEFFIPGLSISKL